MAALRGLEASLTGLCGHEHQTKTSSCRKACYFVLQQAATRKISKCHVQAIQDTEEKQGMVVQASTNPSHHCPNDSSKIDETPVAAVTLHCNT